MDVFIISYLIGVLIGFILGYVAAHTRRISGVLKIDCTDPQKNKYRFEINNLELLSQKKSIILKIDATADLSQE